MATLCMLNIWRIGFRKVVRAPDNVGFLVAGLIVRSAIIRITLLSIGLAQLMRAPCLPSSR